MGLRTRLPKAAAEGHEKCMLGEVMKTEVLLTMLFQKTVQVRAQRFNDVSSKGGHAH